ncbi:jouberin-like isoform X1 [Pomacea canaliculata]|uniref:jouberin-like isoform X1 n=1 Tax=Pomacea canaliculata TaxID=400727 RepID=UPI000D73F8F0|nr:jouberin-like isoform X1 [Pomacea canaliculata]XP_025109172.1 jouberin-like isoform X1 [Pomacea canaliculata]
MAVDEASSSTKVRVEELLQQVVSQSTKEAAEVKKRKKKKTKETDENTVLESLRKGSEITGLHKDEDTALLANIYEPDNSPKNEKSNKQRQRKQQQAASSLISDAESFKTLKDNIEIAELDKKKVKKKKNVEETSLSFPADKILELPPADSFKTPIPKERKKNKTKNMTEPPDITIADPEIPDSPTKISKKKKKEELMEKEVLPDAEKPLPERSKQKKKQTPDAKILNKDTSEADTTMLSPKAVKKKKKKPDELQSSDKEDLQPIHKQDGLSENVMTSPRQKKKKKAKESEPPEEVKPSSSDPSVIPSSEDKKKKKAGSKMSAEAEEKKVSEETQESAEGDATGKKKAKKKRVKAKDGAGDAGVEAEKIEEAPADIPDAGEVLAVMIHRTDKLKNDFNILHPLVRVHIVDENTGQHFPKQHKERAVTSFYETSHDKVDCVLPIMTQPFDFKERKSTIPAWEELLIFNENYNHFIQTTPKALILFEILDFTSMNSTNNRQETGWYHIAWAFLKIVGANDKINVGSRARLQLYQVPPRRITKRDQVEPYQWWKMPKRDPYPSTLYVTLKNTTPPLVVEPSMRSMFATQKEQGAMTYEDLKRSMNWDTKNNRLETRPITTWTRLFGQLCRIPNDLILTLPGLRKGCFVICFSHDGRTLACACGDRDGNPILLYEIPSGKQRMELKGHFSLVYELSWSKKDTHLASASSDGTVRIWNVIEAKPFAEKVLPHPSFVYCCKFHPRVDTVVVSGCYDQVIRVWDISQEEESGQLVQEIEGHLGHVNSLCFNDDDGQKMYSADNTGRINIWNVFVTEETGRRSFIRDWTLYSSLEEPELKGVSISRLELHPTGRRLLVHCRDNAIRMLDLRVQRVMQQYIGAINFREKLGSCMTPCGTFVFAGSEDGYVYAWNTDTGDQVARYTELNYHKPVTDVAYHPRDHIIAMCSLGENQPILVYKYDPFTAQVDAGVTSRGPVETTEVEDLVTGRKSPLLDEGELLSARSKVMTQDEFQAHETARYQRVMKKLESATMHMSQMPGMVTPDTSHRFDSIGRSGAVSSWSATDSGSYIATPRSNMPSPGLMSPHAPQTALTTLQSQQLTLQNRYLKQSDSGWRPTYSEVGRHGSKAPVIYGRPPHISLDTSGGKAQFSFQSPLGSTKKHTKCVVLYDYRAQRSDELTIFRGDIVLLLYKDSDTWWMGELENGQQGFFPANYVTLCR